MSGDWNYQQMNGSSMLPGPIRASEIESNLSDLTGQETSNLSKELLGFFIIVLAVATFVLAPMLVSFSKKKFVRRGRKHRSGYRCCCPKIEEQTDDRDDRRVIIEISEQNIEPENNPLPPVIEKLPLKPCLKKSKMFIEAELAGRTSEATETQVEEAELTTEMEPRGCFPANPLAQIGARVLDIRRADDERGQSTSHSRLTVFENNAYEDTIPSMVESGMEISYASSPVEKFFGVKRDVVNDLPDTKDREKKDDTYQNKFLFGETQKCKKGPFPSNPFLLDYPKTRGNMHSKSSQIRIKRQMSNKERWQPLYPKPKDPETVSMLGYEFANDVIHGHVPPSPLFPAPTFLYQQNTIPQMRNQNVFNPDNDVTNKDPDLKTSSISTILYSPQVGAASTKVSSVSSRRRIKKKVRKTRRYRDQLRNRWQRRILVFNSSNRLGTLDSYDTCNNEKISGFIGNRMHSDALLDDEFEYVWNRKRFQLSETSLLEEIWQHLRLLVERSNQRTDLQDNNKDGTAERNSDASSVQTVVPSTNEQIEAVDRSGTSSTQNSSSGISVQMYPCLTETQENEIAEA